LCSRLDVSRSVDEAKFKLQREGYANAIVDLRVVRAMTGGPVGRIALCFVEWSSQNEQKVVIDWTVIASEDDARIVYGHNSFGERANWITTALTLRF
jgi:Protein of unknown function (DUF1194)